MTVTERFLMVNLSLSNSEPSEVVCIRIILDIDDTFDAVHGGRQLRLFNAYYDEYGFQPIVVFDGAVRFLTTMLRPAKRPSGVEIRAFLRRLLRSIRARGEAENHIKSW
jgi:hypothetical protein